MEKKIHTGIPLFGNRLLFIVNSLNRLMAIAEFRQLLSAERLNVVPAALADRIKMEAIRWQT